MQSAEYDEYRDEKVWTLKEPRCILLGQSNILIVIYNTMQNMQLQEYAQGPEVVQKRSNHSP